MKMIRLNAADWRAPEDFYAALLPQLGAPDWHGRNLDALYDSLSGGISRLEPPFAVEIAGAARLSPDMKAFIAKVVTVFEDARTKLGPDVSLMMH